VSPWMTISSPGPQALVFRAAVPLHGDHAAEDRR
jgi:hypothetical protein